MPLKQCSSYLYWADRVSKLGLNTFLSAPPNIWAWSYLIWTRLQRFQSRVIGLFCNEAKLPLGLVFSRAMNLWKASSLMMQSGGFRTLPSSPPPKIFSRSVYVLEAKRFRERLQSWEKNSECSSQGNSLSLFHHLRCWMVLKQFCAT